MVFDLLVKMAIPFNWTVITVVREFNIQKLPPPLTAICFSLLLSNPCPYVARKLSFLPGVKLTRVTVA